MLSARIHPITNPGSIDFRCLDHETGLTDLRGLFEAS
jgi:hypothetical protein